MKKLLILIGCLFLGLGLMAQSGSAISNTTGVDAVTGALEVIDYAHREIHAGDHYYIQGFFELDDTDSIRVKIVTPNSAKWMHFQFAIKSTGICTSYLDEVATGGMTGGVGTNPVTDNTYMTSQFFVLDLDAGDKFGNLVIRK